MKNIISMRDWIRDNQDKLNQQQKQHSTFILYEFAEEEIASMEVEKEDYEITEEGLIINE